MAKRSRGLTRASMLALQLGPTAAEVKLKASPKQWRAFVKAAHGKGLSMEDYFKGTPKALAPKSTKQLQNQAQATMNAVYAPAEAELTTRESQVKAIDAKRQRDQQYYQDWLNNQTAALSGDVQKSNQMITDKITGMDDAARAAYAQAAQAASANVAHTPGVVSDVTSGNAVKSIPVAAGIADVKRTGESTQELTGAQLAGSLTAASQANNLAAFAANEAKRSADTWKALSDIGGEHTKLTLQKGADAAKEVARLLDQEVTKAQSNRDYGALLQKLDLQGQDIKVKGQKVRTDARLKKQQAAETKRYHTALVNAKTDDRLYRESKDNADRQQKRDEFIAKYGKTPEQWRKMTDAERVDWVKRYSKAKGTGGKGGSTKGALTEGQKLKNYQTFSQFQSSVNTLTKLIKVNPKGGGDPPVSNASKLLAQGYSTEQIKLAYDLWAADQAGLAHHKLSSDSRKYARRVAKSYGQKGLPAGW